MVGWCYVGLHSLSFIAKDSPVEASWVKVHFFYLEDCIQLPVLRNFSVVLTIFFKIFLCQGNSLNSQFIISAFFYFLGLINNYLQFKNF